ncbi:MAG: acylphosphatase [Actinomycetota bacterium]|nr:acylphosphatase [Actinomycetota bacterium]
MIRRRLLISGRVQGIGFRYSCRRVAESAGVAGWCRNLPDGRVEAALEGEPDAVERVVAWCRRGPSHAVVTDVDVVSETPEGVKGFRLG